MRTSLPLPVAVALVLAGFAANSLLCRAALGAGLADAATFSLVRLATGAAALGLLAWGAGQGPTLRPRPWASLALAAYVLGFSFAYRALTAGTGALLLFGAVQVTMLAAAFTRGDAFTPRKVLGALLAFAGLLVLTMPKLGRPPVGAALSMALAGAAWGAYSLLGAGSSRPLGDTQVAFLGAAVLVLPALFFAAPRHLELKGFLLATLSGTLASGATYSLWYAVLPRLGAVRAAVVQLAVPLLAAAAAGLLLGEVPRTGWYVAAALTLSGISLTSWRK